MRWVWFARVGGEGDDPYPIQGQSKAHIEGGCDLPWVSQPPKYHPPTHVNVPSTILVALGIQAFNKKSSPRLHPDEEGGLKGEQTGCFTSP